MKGITPVIAIILLLLITISMVGFAFVWFTRMAETASEAGTSALTDTTTKMATQIRIDNAVQTADSTSITIRNTGSQTVKYSDLVFYVNGVQRGCDAVASTPAVDSFADITSGSSGTCARMCTELSGAACTVTGTQCTVGTTKIKTTSPGNVDEVICS